MYAIGGSAEPTINSQGNRYLAPTNPFAKEVQYSYLSVSSQFIGSMIIVHLLTNFWHEQTAGDKEG
jgi:hypothetical protein